MKDIEYVAQVMKKFAPLNGSGIPVADNIEELTAKLLEQDNVIAVVKEGRGVILGVVYPHFLNPSIIVAQEIGWWVEPEYRGSITAIKLYKEFERKAKQMGVSKLMMISLHSLEPEKVNAMYSKLGYRPIEYTFLKDL